MRRSSRRPTGTWPANIARPPAPIQTAANAYALNEAYRVLEPGTPGTEDAPLLDESPRVKSQGPSLADEVGAWLRQAIDQTKERWQGRVPEIGVLTATTTLLAFLAFSAGASGVLTLATATAALVTIWAPWRRV